MRSLATDEDVDLALDPLAPQTVKLKVEIDRDGSGSGFVEVNDIDGDDFVRGFRRQRTLDMPGPVATVTLAAWLRDPRRWSLSPSMTGSDLHIGGGPLCDAYNRIKVSAKVSYQHGAAGAYHKIFDGRIKSWKQSGQSLTLDCRDMVTDLQSRTIEKERQYGHEDPASVTYSHYEEVIQNILDDNINTVASAPRTNSIDGRTAGSPWQLYGPNGTGATPYPAGDATGADVRLEECPKRTIWEALSVYPSAIAYRLSRRWLNGLGDFALVLEEPDRVAASPVLTIDTALGQGNFRDIGLDIEHVRNRVQIGYQLTGGQRDAYFANDATSEAAYGKRFMGVDVGSASQVDTATEAQKMGDGMLADTKAPLMEPGLKTKFLWFAELNDLIRIKPDYVHTDIDNDLALVGINDTLQQGGGAMSELFLRGKPAAGYLRVVAKQRRLPQPGKRMLRRRPGSSSHANPYFSDDGNV